MAQRIYINKNINKFNKKIQIDGDKSISIRALLLGSQAFGKSIIDNILLSDDIFNSIKCLKKLGIKILLKGKKCTIYGLGINGFKFKKKIHLDAGNSGTFARLILGLLIKTPYPIKLIGDKSLSRRDFGRIIEPLQKIGATFKFNKKKGLPLMILGSQFVNPIIYSENKGSAQCKSSVMLASLNTPGETIIKAKKSRDHSERFFKYLGIPIRIKKNNETDKIFISGQKNFKSFHYKIPSDPSSCAFFIVLTLLSKNSSLILKNVNLNDSRIGYIKILNKMGAKIKIRNLKKRYEEKIGDILVKSQKNLKKINCPPKLNSNLIDEFLILFLVAAKAKGVSIFRNLDELNKKESPRLKLGSKILNLMGVKTKLTSNSIKIYGNSDLKIKKKIVIEDYHKDHRVFMTSVVAGLVFGGNWIIKDVESFKSSFPSFLKIIKNLGIKFKLS
ncbi:3-phosphoshikimate 1-carboxyvinyltransferase [Candidatus Pelagibacter communis]|uniref:3-phosphoshikimate 1-carboxyvinyltransferase n=1 Tax=Pelagibacter ubique TaxID=198252 RepID=UPI0009E51E86|nr:3-phosphoshikimate 1-carboxyvinyltransferase [Candidatus Pelagibacter ubique]